MNVELFPEGTKTKFVKVKGLDRLTQAEHNAFKKRVSNGIKKGFFNIKNKRFIFSFEEGIYFVAVYDGETIREAKYKLLKVEDD